MGNSSYKQREEALDKRLKDIFTAKESQFAKADPKTLKQIREYYENATVVSENNLFAEFQQSLKEHKEIAAIESKVKLQKVGIGFLWGVTGTFAIIGFCGGAGIAKAGVNGLIDESLYYIMEPLALTLLITGGVFIFLGMPGAAVGHHFIDKGIKTNKNEAGRLIENFESHTQKDIDKNQVAGFPEPNITLPQLKRYNSLVNVVQE